MLSNEQIIIDAAILGLLIGIVWSLKYIVMIEKKITRIEKHIEKLLEKKKKR